MIFIRSVLFFVLGIVNTIACGIFVLPLCFIRFEWGYDSARIWGTITLWLAKVVCGINYTVRGMENIPAHPCVSMAKHQSAWETVFLLSTLLALSGLSNVSCSGCRSSAGCCSR